MVDLEKVSELIEKYFAEVTPEKFQQDLQESCPEIFEPGAESWKSKYKYYPTSEEVIKQAKERLVYPIGRSCALETPAGEDFQENGNNPHYSIRMLKLFELGYGHDLLEVMAKYIEYSDIKFDRIVDIQPDLSKEGYYLGAGVASFLRKPCVILDKEENQQTGKLLQNERVAIASDILTTGDNIIESVNYLRGKPENIVVQDAFVLVTQAVGDRLQAIQQQLQQMNINLHYLIDIKELVDRLSQRKYITEADRQEIYKDKDFAGFTPDVS